MLQRLIHLTPFTGSHDRTINRRYLSDGRTNQNLRRQRRHFVGRMLRVLISFLEDSGPAVQLLYLNDRILRSAQYDIIKFVRLIK